MTVLGTAWIEILPNTENFAGKLSEGVRSGAEKAQAETGSTLGGIATGVAGIAAVGLAVGGVLIDVGEKFQGAFHTIQQRTGETGQALVGLEGDFKRVFATTPGATFQNVAQALSEVEVRTHLTGPPLDALTSKFIELGKITGTDVNQNVQKATALFGQFGVAAGSQGKALDVLFKASQVAGVGVDTLEQNMTTAAPTAQALGLNINQTAALVAQLTAAGLPAQKVMMGLGSEFQKAAKAGKDPTAVIGQLVNEIKKAPNATEATTLAMTKFGLGARQAATFVDAARSGAFNFGDTLAKITSGKGGISDTAEATMSLGDRFKVFKNSALVAIEPVATRFLEFADVIASKLPGAFRAVTSALAPFVKAIEAGVKLFVTDFLGGFQSGEHAAGTFGGAISNLGSTVRGVFEGIRSAVSSSLTAVTGAWHQVVAGFVSGTAPLSGVGKIFGDIGIAIRAFVEGFKGASTSAGAGPLVNTLTTLGNVARTVFEWLDQHRVVLYLLGAAFLAMFSPVTAIVAGFVLLYTKVKVFHDVVNAVVNFVTGTLLPAFASFASFVAGQLGPVITGLASRWQQVVTIIKAVVFPFVVAIVLVFKGLQLFWETFHATILRIVKTVWNQIKLAIETPIRILKDLIFLVLDLLTGKWGKVWKDVKDIFAAVWKDIGGTISNIGSIIGNVLASLGGIVLRELGKIPGLVLQALAGLGSLIVSAFVGAWDYLVGDLPGEIVALLKFFALDLPQAITGAVAGAASWLVGVGLSMLTGLVGDVEGSVSVLSGWLTKLPGRIVGWLGDAASWLVGLGVKAITGFVADFEVAAPIIASWLAGLPGRIVGWLGDAASWLVGLGVKAITGFVADFEIAAPIIADWLSKLPGRVVGWLGDAASWLVDEGGKVIQGLINGLGSAANGALHFVLGTLPGMITGWLSDAGKWLFDTGKAIVQGVIDGIGSMAGALLQKAKDVIVGPLKNLPIVGGLFGSPSPYYITVGKAMMQGLSIGMSAGAPQAHDTLRKALVMGVPELPALRAIPAAAGAAAGAEPRSVKYELNVTGVPITTLDEASVRRTFKTMELLANLS